MPTPAKKPATTPIPVQLSQTEFHQFILPHLSMPKCGELITSDAQLDYIADFDLDYLIIEMPFS